MRNVVLDFLLIVDAALDAEVEFLAVVVLLEILANSGCHDLLGCEFQ